ncbi:prepilin-type N-terminal cleavage/methylation domain-containing protein [Psychrobium sp. 1_MG-2023]|uniref:type IV pilus modification PilV family protein n=1 Tax=Psychrobium sp. 1_MG-2023 TaxID=3062624 RepID=UPI000C32BBF3|nr:type II secretion system protein [Psychrobium sp. 1_MG-2023]MDP2560725.1 type II secretion system protein [Psychrobium sp. 1_MG-2023]PKF56617.1 prepilin-type cleavage/methylation domain-containing protein [Alteromonadales bacterium alter-6D02]
MRYNQQILKINRGFTLVELIIGIVAFAIAMTLLTGLIFPQVQRSVDPIFEIRATKLANTLLNEIRGKAFDENSNPGLGLTRCGESGVLCTASGDLGSDGESRDAYNDVDDYHDFKITGTMLSSSLKYDDLYVNYSLKVEVFYDNDYDGVKDAASVTATNVKLIMIDVTLPNDDVLSFASYRGNF